MSHSTLFGIYGLEQDNKNFRFCAVAGDKNGGCARPLQDSTKTERIWLTVATMKKIP